MRFGINTFLFTSPFTNDSTKLFPQFKKWGFDSVEIPIEDPSHIDPARVKTAAEKAGLAIGSICACMGPGRDFRGSTDEQKTAMAYCKALIDQASAIGCPRIIGPLYSVVGLTGAHDDVANAVAGAAVHASQPPQDTISGVFGYGGRVTLMRTAPAQVFSPPPDWHSDVRLMRASAPIKPH